MNKITRVALITSGGDCQGLNAAMRGIGKALHNKVENTNKKRTDGKFRLSLNF